jgi:hypothetical protein
MPWLIKYFGCKNTHYFNNPQILRLVIRRFCGLLAAKDDKNGVRLFLRDKKRK